MSDRLGRFQVFLQRRLRPPGFWVALAVSTVGYFICARLAQDWFFPASPRPPEMFLSYGGYVRPEPLELPLFALGYVVIPVLALILQPFVGTLAANWSRWRQARRWFALVAGVFVLLAAIARWNQLVGFGLTAAAYLQREGMARALWLLVTKRLWVNQLLLLLAAVGFAVVALVSRRRAVTVLLTPAAEARLARWRWLAVSFAVLVVIHPNFPTDYHHFSYFMGPVNDQLHGKPLLAETTNLYGILSHYFLAGVFGLGLLPLRYPSLTLVVTMFFVGFFLGWYAVLRRWLNSETFALLGLVTLVAVLFLFQTSPTRSAYNFPAMTPFRFWPVLPVAALLIAPAGARWRRQLAIALSCVAVGWNLEFGAALAMATGFTLLVAESGPLARRLWRLALSYAFWLGAVFLAITVGNVIVYSRLPDWLPYLNEVRRFSRGENSSPLPVVGLFGGMVFTSLAVVISQLQRKRLRTAVDQPLLLLAVYGAVAIAHYVAESTWQQLFLALWPYTLVWLTLIDRYFSVQKHLSQASHERRSDEHIRHRQDGASANVTMNPWITGAVAAGLIAVFGLVAVKLPVEFANRNYARAITDFIQPPAVDLPLVRDAAILNREYVGERLAVYHLNDSKLLVYAGKVNLLPVVYSFTRYTKPQVAALVEVVKREQPTFVFLGRPEGGIVADQMIRRDQLEHFRTLLPAAYVLDRRLETLDVYRRR